MVIGARTVKTGLAVSLTLILCNTFKLEPATFAAITAVVNMQPSVSKSINNAGQQIGVHLLGAALSLIMGLTLGPNPLTIGAAVIIIILLCNKIGWSDGISLGIVSIIFILSSPSETFLTHALGRTLTIFVGLGVALLINRVLVPPKHKPKLLSSLHTLLLFSSEYFFESLHTFIQAGSLTSYEKPDPQKQKSLLDEVTVLYENAREEITIEDNPTIIEKLLDICHGFIERGQNINEMTYQRVRRRQELTSPIDQEISATFQDILHHLSIGTEKISELITTLDRGLAEKKSFGIFGQDPQYWELFDQYIDSWNRRVSGLFYLRALMEVTVVATELRWASRRTKKLLNLLDKQYALLPKNALPTHQR